MIVRTHAGRDDGELLAEEPFGWFAAPGWQHRAGEPLPLATLAEPCGVRAMAGQLLDTARMLIRVMGMVWLLCVELSCVALRCGSLEGRPCQLF